jgi:hypothetical protein
MSNGDFPLTNRLIGLLGSRLVPGRSCTGDFLRRLGDAEIEELATGADAFLAQGPVSGSARDTFSVLLQLVFLETGLPSVKLGLDQIQEYASGIRVMISLVRFERMGLLRVASRLALEDLPNGELEIEMTDDGRRYFEGARFDGDSWDVARWN